MIVIQMASRYVSNSILVCGQVLKQRVQAGNLTRNYCYYYYSKH